MSPCPGPEVRKAKSAASGTLRAARTPARKAPMLEGLVNHRPSPGRACGRLRGLCA